MTTINGNDLTYGQEGDAMAQANSTRCSKCNDRADHSTLEGKPMCDIHIDAYWDAKER